MSPGSKEKKKEVEEDAGGLDWGAPIIKKEEDDEDELKLEWSDDDNDDSEDDNIEPKKHTLESEASEDIEVEAVPSGPVKTDIMSQQLKFMACLKIMMEELSTIATGFEMEGGIIRSQLYVWLEKEVKTTLKKSCSHEMSQVEALNELCNYGGGVIKDADLPITEVRI